MVCFDLEKLGNSACGEKMLHGGQEDSKSLHIGVSLTSFLQKPIYHKSIYLFLTAFISKLQLTESLICVRQEGKGFCTHRFNPQTVSQVRYWYPLYVDEKVKLKDCKEIPQCC